MSDQAPHVELDLPTPGLDTSSSSKPQHVESANAKDTAFNTAQSVMDSVSNHPATQSAKDTVVNGPLGSTIKDQSAKTSSEFQDLQNSKRVPDHPAATGQPLTHYHSMFYRLLSWKNPRATAISFISCLIVIFAARYLNIIRYAFKATYMLLGITSAAEIAGHFFLGDGLATRMRPRKYFVIPKESLERFLDDFEQLINFFVIEFQRIVFAENIWVTVGAFFVSFFSYFLVKWLPLWGLSLLATSTVYLAPLIYIKNKEVIDAHLEHAGNVVTQQASQVKDLASQHTGRAAETARSYVGEYTQKAQGMIGQSRQKITGVTNGNGTTAPIVKSEDFPAAPKEVYPDAPKAEPISHAEVPKAEPEAVY